MDYRWDKPWDHSIAFFRFRTYHKQLNEMYWAFYYGTAALGKDAGKVKKSGISSKDYFNFAVDSIDYPNYNVVKDWHCILLTSIADKSELYSYFPSILQRYSFVRFKFDKTEKSL